MQHDDIFEAVKTFKWYLLPSNKATITYQIFLHNSQQPHEMRIAGLSPMNMETCLAVRAVDLFIRTSIRYLNELFSLFSLNADTESLLFVCNGYAFHALRKCA